MATFVQVEEGNFNNLPPLKELFLEIQIQKLIHEYLFSSNAGEMRLSLPDESSEHKQIDKAADWLYAADTALQSAHNAPCVNSTEAFDNDHKLSPCDPHRKSDSQASPTLHSITCIEDCGMNGTKDQTVTGNALLTANSAHEASLATLSVESGGKVMHKTAHLSRVGTFPCKGSVQLQVEMPTKTKTEIKASCKKPPRPPKLPKSGLSVSLARCCSDNGTYLQSIARRERKRKATAMATSSVSTSILAVLFTLCFAIIMIAQGFWSQSSQNFSAYGSDASSPPPTQTHMRASSKQSAEDSNLAGLAERQASMEGFSTKREASSESVLAQSYVVRKVLLQPSFRYEALKT